MRCINNVGLTITKRCQMCTGCLRVVQKESHQAFVITLSKFTPWTSRNTVLWNINITQHGATRTTFLRLVMSKSKNSSLSSKPCLHQRPTVWRITYSPWHHILFFAWNFHEETSTRTQLLIPKHEDVLNNSNSNSADNFITRRNMRVITMAHIK